MSLNFEQCKEVVEKVWGWKSGEWYHGDHLLPSYISPDGKDAVAERDLVDYEVNSWEGFGRTVEAMEQKGFTYEKDCVSLQFWKCIGQEEKEPFAPIHRYGEATIGKPFKAHEMIEATHLAALEAIKGEDEG